MRRSIIPYSNTGFQQPMGSTAKATSIVATNEIEQNFSATEFWFPKNLLLGRSYKVGPPIIDRSAIGDSVYTPLCVKLTPDGSDCTLVC